MKGLLCRVFMCGFTIGANEIKKVVSQLEPVFSSGIGNAPSILFEVGEKIIAKSANEDAKVSIVFDADNKEDGSFVVNGDVFAGIIRKSSSGNISVATEGNFLVIDNNSCKFKVVLSDLNKEYFEEQELENSGTFAIEAQQLKSAISSVNCCIDQAKQHLNCVMIHSIEEDGQKIAVVATDGMRLGVAERTAQFNKQIPELMIPKKATECIINAIGDAQDTISIEYNDNALRVSNGIITYSTRLLDTRFPKYRSVIPEGNDSVLEVDSKDFQELITYLTSIADNSFHIRIVLSKDTLMLSCDANGNNSSGSIQATYVGTEPMEIVCNYRLLQEILKKIPSKVRFKILDSTTPLLIQQVGDDSAKYIFMPFVS